MSRFHRSSSLACRKVPLAAIRIGAPCVIHLHAGMSTTSKTGAPRGAVVREHHSQVKLPPADLEMGMIGNGTFNALVDKQGRIVWSCLPRPDSDPFFCSLLRHSEDLEEQHDGAFGIELLNCVETKQEYLRNTAVLVTTLLDASGSGVRITDFAPKFTNFQRSFRPVQIVRRIEPIGPGPVRIITRVRPRHTYGASPCETTRGTNHVRYLTPEHVMRLTSTIPVTFIVDETPFVIESAATLILGPDESLSDTPHAIANSFLEQTTDYWFSFCQTLAIPFEYQAQVIRSAITLTLCMFEETGAVIAAATTSIPEFRDSGRCWDYRFCWLRDSYFVISALNRLGASHVMEKYLDFLVNIIVASPDGYLQPMFGIGLEHKLDEWTCDHLVGYRGMGPVRVGNAAYTQVQNDSYGSVILACTQAFFDERLRKPGNRQLFEKLEKLGHQALARYCQSDAGLWEYRGTELTHTFSSIMCWAACDRLGAIAGRVAPEREQFWKDGAAKMHATILEHSFSKEMNSFSDTWDAKNGAGDGIDACLLLLPELGFIDAKDDRFVGTVRKVEAVLLKGEHVFRYVHEDDFGVPETAFNICTFWLITALSQIGEKDRAKALFQNMLNCRNAVGLLSEDIDVATHELWGNYPQLYSLVGLIRCALSLSDPWDANQ